MPVKIIKDGTHDSVLQPVLNTNIKLNVDHDSVLQSVLKGRKEMCYLTTHSIHFIYGYMASDIWLRTILIVKRKPAVDTYVTLSD